jgi:predicted GTPase
MKKKLTMALAGNANVGKTAIFNSLTGMHQHIGNWPGKTIEKKKELFSSRATQWTLLTCLESILSPRFPWKKKFPGSTLQGKNRTS